ncbi:MAG: argininosuccinate lyase [Desulfobacteraceae bacterium]|nr:MAG: argininosuccinate lyase [Desulfobacteraceae bacterium]
MSEKPWDGRFSEKTDTSVEAFTSSIQVDKRLYLHDIQGSAVHCKMLAKQSIIQEEDADDILEGLGKVRMEIERGEFHFDDSLEDIHMHIERSLADKITKAAHKLHTARSRNDQVAVDTRLYLKDSVKEILGQLLALRQVFVDLAKQHLDVILPGYTHLQRAQPVLFSHHMMAYYEMFTRDFERFSDGLKRIDVNPLGSAALAGTTYPIDRDYTTRELGFAKASANSIDAVSDRDYMMEFLSAAGICMVHFSRISEELILWSSAEFQFIELPDSFATGSSIMPQKKNPDVPELVRGKTGRVFGNMIALFTIMKSLPLAYNRDMQEDKEPLFDTIDTLKACIDIYTKMMPKVVIRKDRMLEATTTGYLNATELADYLVGKGIPFREAHSCSGKAVSYAIGKGKELQDLELDEMKLFSKRIESDLFDFLGTRAMVDRRKSFGGTATENVKHAIAAAEEQLKTETTGTGI